MTVDVENRIRDVLHRQAAEVTTEKLRFAAGPRAVTPPGRRRPFAARLAPAVVAACVAAVAVVIAVVAGGGGHDRTPAGGAGQAATTALAGTAWRLESVQKPDGTTVAIPARLSAVVAFERNGKTLGAGVGGSYTDAGYTVTAAGDLVVTPVGTTGSGYAGHDPAILTALDAMTAITYGRAERSTGASVAVTVEPRLLRFAADGYVLTFVDKVSVATSATGAAGTRSAVPSFHS